MKISPVKSYKKPAYPTREYYILNSEALKNHIPDKWKTNKIVAGALAVFLLSNSNNTESKNKNPKPEIFFIKNLEENSQKDIKNISEKNIPSIAPIFIHGDGRGAIGCVVINPPAFLSEEEARYIIESELKKEDIIFDKKNYKLDDVVFTRDEGYRKNEADTVVMDGYSSKYNIAYEFVSADDYHNFGGEYSISTVQSYDVVKAAENLRDKMKEYGKVNTVIFYDPMARQDNKEAKNETYSKESTINNLEDEDNIDEGTKDKDELYYSYNNQIKEYKKASIELLKQQVHDFIEWVKKENLLKGN